MKSENILRAARNSLLCFFMALGAGFLVACGGGAAVPREAAPLAPLAPEVREQNESEILVTWSAVQGATSYRLYWSESSDGPYIQIGGDIFAFRYLDARGLDPNTEYFYQLEACNSGGCSRRSTKVSATTRVSPPVLTVSAQSESEIEATWDAVEGATSYRIHRATVSGGTYARIGGDNLSTLTLRYLDSGRLSPGTEYFYQLDACNSGGCSRRSAEVSATTYLQEFAVYFSDSAAEGVEYSGTIGNGLTWKGGVFSATKGVFEFSIADTTLGSVSLNIDWANAHVTPADFIGVNEQQVIKIARIVQGLDEDGLPQQKGISVSERARTDVRGDLFDRLTNGNDDVFVPSSADRSGTFLEAKTYRIPNEETAREHFVATRKCLFSGVYDGDYRATVGPTDEGQIYYAIEPFADLARANGAKQATGVKHSNEDSFVENNDGSPTALSGPVNIGVIGSTITLSPGNELSFVTPRLVTGIWQEVEANVTTSGTSRITLAEGNPGATRRIVGVERVNGGGPKVIGLYVLDYFANDDDGDGDGSFSGRYYDVKGNVNYPLALTIAGGGSWSAGTTDLILSGTRGNGDNKIATAITVRSVSGDNYGSFEADVKITDLDLGVISGTWCDISGAVGVADPPEPLPQSPAAPRAVATSAERIDIAWDYPIVGARTYNLYRRTTRESRHVLVDGGIETRGYRDSGLSAGTKYFYQLEACNTSGCSTRSPEVSATTFSSSSP